MPQTRFAAMVDIDRGYLIGIEHGEQNPSLDKIERIAAGLGISVSRLFEGVCEDVAPRTSQETYEYRHTVI